MCIRSHYHTTMSNSGALRASEGVRIGVADRHQARDAPCTCTRARIPEGLRPAAQLCLSQSGQMPGYPGTPDPQGLGARMPEHSSRGVGGLGYPGIRCPDHSVTEGTPAGRLTSTPAKRVSWIQKSVFRRAQLGATQWSHLICSNFYNSRFQNNRVEKVDLPGYPGTGTLGP